MNKVLKRLRFIRKPVTATLAFGLLSLTQVYAAEEPPAIAISDFVCTSDDPDYAPLGPGVSEIITAEISASGQFRVEERSRVREAVEELQFSQTDLADKEKQVELGKFLGADYVLMGTVTPFAGVVTINARLVDVATGEAVRAGSRDAPAVEDVPTTARELARSIVAAEGPAVAEGPSPGETGDIFFAAAFEEPARPEAMFIKTGEWGTKLCVEEGHLRLGDGDGKNKEACATVLIGDQDWRDYYVTGRFYLEKSSGNSIFVIHTLISGNQQTFFTIAEGKKPKIVDVYGPTSFNKPKREKSMDVGVTMAFGTLPGLMTAKDQEAYKSGVKNCEGFWSVLGESSGKIGGKEWRDFKVVVNGQEVSLYINEKLMVRGGSSRDRGNLGFSATDDCIVYLDDVEVGCLEE